VRTDSAVPLTPSIAVEAEYAEAKILRVALLPQPGVRGVAASRENLLAVRSPIVIGVVNRQETKGRFVTAGTTRRVGAVSDQAAQFVLTVPGKLPRVPARATDIQEPARVAMQILGRTPVLASQRLGLAAIGAAPLGDDHAASLADALPLSDGDSAAGVRTVGVVAGARVVFPAPLAARLDEDDAAGHTGTLFSRHGVLQDRRGVTPGLFQAAPGIAASSVAGGGNVS
jgi:hypothetical protein